MTVDEVAKTKENGGRRSRRRARQVVAQSSQPVQAAGQSRKERPAPARHDAAKPNIFVRAWRGLREYLSTTRAELQKVTWPTRQETLRLSGIVLGVTIVFSIALGLLDLVYGQLFTLGFNTPALFIVFAVIVVVVVGGSALMLRRRSGL
jgi:preprotein translocase subunit SecE